MGCDIHGRIEVNKRHDPDRDDWWLEAGRLLPFVGRSYDSFGTLFGVRNYCSMPPIAERRGFPNDAARTTREDYEDWCDDAHSASHVTYQELLDADWTKTAEQPDERYSILDEDKEPTGTKFALGPSNGWTEIVQENREAIEAGEPVAGPDGERYIQRRVQSRRESLSGAWEWFIFEYLDKLTDRYERGAIRLVVWFDN